MQSSLVNFKRELTTNGLKKNRSAVFFQFVLQIVIFQVPEEFRDDCPDDHTLECSYDDTSERDVLEDSLSWLSWDGDKVASLISFVCSLSSIKGGVPGS